jgi:hypothetical protein
MIIDSFCSQKYIFKSFLFSVHFRAFAMYPNLTVYDGPMDVEIYVSRFLEYLYIDNNWCSVLQYKVCETERKASFTDINPVNSIRMLI